MSGETDDQARSFGADERDDLADRRDAIADERDVAADARDVIAGDRETVADAREMQLLAWQQELEGRARRLGLVPEPSEADPARADAAHARQAAAQARASRLAEREEATRLRDLAAQERLAARRDTLLAAVFAGVAERLYEARTPEDLVTRIAEEAVVTIAGASKASVTVDRERAEPGPGSAESAPVDQRTRGGAPDSDAMLSIPLAAALGEPGAGTASLNVFAPDASALDDSARDIGFILAAHAALASRALGERVRLERVSEQLERALTSRDVIGQAKGILMERLKTTPDHAFELLRQASQRLNIKLREVAQQLTETGEVDRLR